MKLIKVEDLNNLLNKQIAISDWKLISQERIDTFADCTEDYQFIHVDEKRAKNEGPFGNTIAHGFLSLSLLSTFANEAALSIENLKIVINYGFDKIRFIHPVNSGSRVRALFSLLGFSERNKNQFLIKYKVVIEIYGQKKPALVAEWLTLQII